MHKFIFGEGAERMVSRFREVGPGERFVGPLLVAKESRFIEDIQESYKDQKKFHEMFCRTQIKVHPPDNIPLSFSSCACTPYPPVHLSIQEP